MSTELVLFWIFGIATLASALGVLTLRNPVASAMSLVTSFFFLAGIYALLWAHTIAVLQVLVYAGAIMVLFLFVIMLLSVQDLGPLVKWSSARAISIAAVVGLFSALAVSLIRWPTTGPQWAGDNTRLATYGTLQQLGQVLYTQWLFPFEAVSLLLLVAIVGAVVVAKSRI